ncbi:MAG: DUF4230 domain-containing protein [Coriobacteriales bacterium]
MAEREGKSRKKRSISKSFTVKVGLICLAAGLIFGIIGTIFVLNHNPKDEQGLSPSVVFSRIVSQNELVTASQDYSIVDKVPNTMSFFGLFDLPFTSNSFWYRYVGKIKAGVSLETAEIKTFINVITVTLDQPYIISNTPNMEKSRVLEENNNILNPIHIENVDAFRAKCVEDSEREAVEGGLIAEARTNAENDIRNIFIGAFGDRYTVNFVWRDAS